MAGSDANLGVAVDEVELTSRYGEVNWLAHEIIATGDDEELDEGEQLYLVHTQKPEHVALFHVRDDLGDQSIVTCVAHGRLDTASASDGEFSPPDGEVLDKIEDKEHEYVLSLDDGVVLVDDESRVYIRFAGGDSILS